MSVAHVEHIRQSYGRQSESLKLSLMNTLRETQSKFVAIPINEDQANEKLEGAGTRRDGLTSLNLSAYAVAHVYNDFMATCWFMYLMYFLTYIVNLGAGIASIALMSGQIADGFATIIVGVLIDKTNTRFGKNKPWYIFGFILVLPSFLLTFNT